MRQQERQRRLAQSCLAYNDSLRRRGSEFIVSHELKILYCIVGKVACTSWLRVLAASTHRETGGAVGRRAKPDRRSWKLPAVPGRGLGRDGGETVALRHERLLHVHVRARAAGEARVGVPRQDDPRLTVVVAEAKYHSQLSTTDEQVCSHVYNFIGNESVPIQLAQCWFPGLDISNAKLEIFFFQIIYTEAIL